MAKDAKKTTKIGRLGERLKAVGERSEANRDHIVCPMAKMLKKMDDETAKCLYDVLNDDVTTTSDIIREMRSSGIRIARQTIYDYRARVCSCAHEDKCGLDEKFSE